MRKILSNEEIEMLAEKYLLIKNSRSKTLQSLYPTYEDFVFKFLASEYEQELCKELN